MPKGDSWELTVAALMRDGSSDNLGCFDGTMEESFGASPSPASASLGFAGMASHRPSDESEDLLVNTHKQPRQGSGHFLVATLMPLDGPPMVEECTKEESAISHEVVNSHQVSA